VASANVGIGLSCIPLIVSSVPVDLALGVVCVGGVLAASATVLGAAGRTRAASKELGIAGLVVSILSLIWTIGADVCTIVF
jgi:hypothetical protein